VKIRGAAIIPFELVLGRPVVTSGASQRVRCGQLLRLETDSGSVGWGEASPLESFGTESPAHCSAAMHGLVAELPGREIADRGAWLPDLAAESPMTFAAAECAILDLVAQSRGLPLWQLLSGLDASSENVTPSVGISALVLGESTSQLIESAEGLRADGYETFKLKVAAREVSEDVARVAALRKVLGSGPRIRLDANQGWSEAVAMTALASLAPFDIEFVEQPVLATDLAGLGRLRCKSPIPLAADEAAVSEGAARAVIEAYAADLIVIKPSAAGGLAASLRIAAAAHARQLRVIVTTLLDSAIATAAAAHVATAIRSRHEMPDCGLATGDLFVCDLASGIETRGGVLVLPATSGLGVAPDPEWLANRGDA